MGFDWCTFEALLLSMEYCDSRKDALTLARQFVCCTPHQLNGLFTKYAFFNAIGKLEPGYNSEKLFELLGFSTLDSIDNSPYENATIIHNMNKPITTEKKYDYIFDGGTTEHIFNMPQVYENIINLLEIGGIYCSVTVNNNFSGHGIYQFSPDFFMSTLNRKYGMELQQLYLIQEGNYLHDRIEIDGFDKNTSRFYTDVPVYIVAIAKKISNERASLIDDPPNQHRYEIDWSKPRST
jgi:hypothetical protein